MSQQCSVRASASSVPTVSDHRAHEDRAPERGGKSQQRNVPKVVTEASTSCPSEQLGSQFLPKASAEAETESSSSGIPSGQGESQPWAEVGEFQIPASSSVGPVLHGAKGHPAQRGHLEEAAFQLQQIFRIDISIALNILGIESMRAGHCRVGYTCFKLAADRGYSKAQFNVGLCYEHGRGTEKDLEKAALYYCHAASSCHPMAQYRYGRYLLQHSPGQHWDSQHRALALLERAAVAGVTEAQAYLGVFYMRGQQPQQKRGLNYLLLAANSGDAQSRYHMGVCYEQGLGVQQNLAEALRHYREAAAAGNGHAQERLRLWEQELEGYLWQTPAICCLLLGKDYAPKSNGLEREWNKIIKVGKDLQDQVQPLSPPHQPDQSPECHIQWKLWAPGTDMGDVPVLILGCLTKCKSSVVEPQKLEGSV
ncbi:death ligand signal enhancer [Willisornis vidua]|uniref:Death ligand signal enhancer n=1 Tax=Willisornis vidua TaxID=1566151 RepID=A0ABQ9CY77_9PASS|nr:death ligand signal enhancer [Willisornis vidua]